MPRRRRSNGNSFLQRARQNTSANRYRPVADRIYNAFNEEWLARVSERQWVPFIDLTDIEDRRRFHPNRLANLPGGPAPLDARGQARVVVVPENHPLARKAPWRGTVPLDQAVRRRLRVGSIDAFNRRRWFPWDFQRPQRLRDAYGNPYDAYANQDVPRAVGFQHPWQVMICIRRRRRREVMHALGHAGRAGHQRKHKRNYWSEVRC